MTTYPDVIPGANSFITVLDLAVRDLIWTKFSDLMELTTKSTDMVFYPKEVAMRQIAERRGETTVDYINYWRTRTDPDLARMRTPVARRGIMVAYDDSDLKTNVVTMYAMPVDLSYNIWFWSKDQNKLNLVMERYLFWQQRNPNLNLSLDDVYPLQMDLHFGAAANESSVETMFNEGLYFCWKLVLKVDGWVFQEDAQKTIHKVVLKIYNEEGDEDVLLFEVEYDFTA